MLATTLATEQQARCDLVSYLIELEICKQITNAETAACTPAEIVPEYLRCLGINVNIVAKMMLDVYKLIMLMEAGIANLKLLNHVPRIYNM